MELRELIWRAAIGNRTIHIKHLDQNQLELLERHQTHPESTPTRGAFRHIECTAILTEDEAYEASKAPSQSVPAGEDPTCYVQPWESRHSNCYSLGEGTLIEEAWDRLFEQVEDSIAKRGRITMCSLLGVSRQIYREGFKVFWSTNTFSFDDPYSFVEFLGSLTLSQKRHLTKLHVFRELYDRGSRDWEYELGYVERNRNNLRLLQGLKTLHLCFEQRSLSDTLVSQYKEMAHRSEVLVREMCQPWSALHTSPLANVTVVISDDPALLQLNNRLMDRCTVAQKNWVAEKIRKSLTNEETVVQGRQEILEASRLKNASKKH